MRLLRDFVLFGRLRSLSAARRGVAQRAYTITVPAPLATDVGNVVALRRPVTHATASRRDATHAAPVSPLLARAANQ